jgi:hypothetical protein
MWQQLQQMGQVMVTSSLQDRMCQRCGTMTLLKVKASCVAARMARLCNKCLHVCSSCLTQESAHDCGAWIHAPDQEPPSFREAACTAVRHISYLSCLRNHHVRSSSM